jgi:dTDP-4-dehydrorhamnose reductase
MRGDSPMTGAPRTLLLGARSQLGHDILRAWPERTVTPLDRAACDVTDEAAVRAAIAAHRPELVLNLAAVHRVDDVEGDPGAALRVNAHGAWIVARTAAEAGAAVMWVSTDYVFAGDRGSPYAEDDPVGPINAYGATKAAGERLVAIANPRHVVVRSSGLYGLAGSSGKGGNFVQTMLRLAREGRPIRVVADETLSMTGTLDLAHALAALARSEECGTFHVTNAGALSWYEFAATIFRLAGLTPDLSATTSAAYGAPARRPAFSALENRRLRELGLPTLRPIEDALTDYLRETGDLARSA